MSEINLQNENFLINYLKDEKGMSEPDIAEFMNVYRTLSPKELSEFIYELAGKGIYKTYPVDMKTFIHDPYYLGTIYDDIIFDIWDNMLQEIYPAPLCKTCEEVVLSCATRCFGKGTEILMYDGSIKKVEDVVVGDLVMGDDSTPRTVLSLSRGKSDMYKVIPNNGKPFICNKEHILPLRCTADKERSTFYKKDKIDEISVSDYIEKPNHYKHMMKLYKVPVQFNNLQKLEVDPYIYGLWIGDGNTDRCSLTTIDKEIETAWLSYFAECKISVHEKNDTKAKSFHVSHNDTNNKLVSVIKESNKSGVKRIVPKYLKASWQDRLKLLAGIIDTDGTLNKKGNCVSIYSKHRGLAEDYVFLSRSLGFKTSLLVKHKKLKYKNNVTYTSYEVSISGYLSQIPTILKRKQVEKDKCKVNPLNTGFKIEYVGTDSFYGFEVDGNHRFLLKDFTVQHNSGKSTTTVVSLAYEMYLLMCMINPAKTIIGKTVGSLVFAVLSKDNATAVSQIGSDLHKVFSLSPFFQERVDANLPYSNIEKKGVLITDNILLKAGSSLSTIIGTDLYAGCLDEANMPSTKIAIEKLIEVRMQIYKEMIDRRKATLDKAPALSGILWLTSSPTDEGDMIGARIQQVRDQNIPNVMIKDNIARWEARGTYATETFDFFMGSDTKDPCLLEDVPELVLTPEEMADRVIQVPRTIAYLNDFRSDPVHSIQNIAGRRTVAENSFFNSVAIFEDVFYKENNIFSQDELQIALNGCLNVEDYLIDKDYFSHPVKPECYRYIHLDIASKKDRFGMSSVYSDSVKFTSAEGEETIKRMYYIDFCVGVVPRGKDPVDILKILEFVYGLKKKGYPLKIVTTDNHQGELARQIIAKRGVKTEYLSVEKTKEPYYNLKNLILTRSLIGFRNPILTKELHGLRESEKKIEKSKGNTDDLSDSLAGALYSCSSDRFYKRTEGDVKDLITNFKDQQRFNAHQAMDPFRQYKKFKF